MAYPASYDSFIPVKKKGDSVTETLTIPASATPVSVTVGYPILSNVIVPGYTEVSTTPSTNQFQVFYGSNTILFGPAGAPAIVSITYVTKGTLLTDLPIQGMIDSIVALEQMLGLNPQGTFTTLVERLLAIESGGTHQHLIYDGSALCDGGNVTFILPQAPTQPLATFVILNTATYTYSQGFTISGDTITFSVAPSAGSKLIVFYVV